MKPGTFLWAMEQLIAGKKIARQDWDDKTFYYYNDNGVVMFNDSCEEPGRANPPKGLANEDDWIIWTPPVNYIPGTFPWAWEQLKAGKKVKVCEHLYSRDRTLYVHKQGEHFKFQIDGDPPYLVEHIHYTLINATDWELA